MLQTGRMQCPTCAAENPEAHRFCDACGEPLILCAQCGAMGRPGARFCGLCGAHLTGPEGAPSESTEPRRADHVGAALAAGATAVAADTSDPDYAALADGCARGEQWTEAMEYAARAAAAAAERQAYGEAVERYTQALDAAGHLDPPPSRMVVALHSECGAALHAEGEYERGAAHYEQALAIARDSGRGADQVDALLGLADAYFELHRPEPAEHSSDEALALAADLEDPAREAAALIRRATCIAAWRGPIAEARSAAKAALERTDGVDDAHLRSRALIVLGSILQWRTDLDSSLPYLHEGAHLSERLADESLRAHALCHLGNAYRAKGRYEQALRWFAELCRYADRTHDAAWMVRAPHGVAAVHLELYDLDTAIGVAQEGEELARRLSRWPEPRAHCLLAIAMAYLAGDAHDAADQHLCRAEALLDHDSWGRWRWHVPLLRLRAELALAVDQRDAAWRYASESLEMAAQADAREHVAHAKLVLGEIAAAQDRLPEALQLLRAAASLAEHIHAVRQLWLASRALGLVAARLGQDRDAEAHLTQAAQIIEAIATDVANPALRASFTRARPIAEVYRHLGHRPLP